MRKRIFYFLFSAAFLAILLVPTFVRAQTTVSPESERVCRIEAFSQELVEVPRLPFSDVFDRFVNPAALALVLANLSLATRFSNVLRFLQQFFQEPILLLLRRRRRGYGTVFESLSKQPIDLALVRVIDAETNRVVASRVTDRDGRFYAMVPAGNYRFAVVKRGFDFPSRYLAGETSDETFGQINTGQAVLASGKGGIDVNLPIDGPADDAPAAQILKRHSRRFVQTVLAYAGLILGAISTIFAWTILSWILLAVHVILFLLFSRLTYIPFGKPWGTVKNQRTGEKLSRAVVRIVDNHYNKVLDSRVTNRAGQYGFIVGKNVYRLFTDKPSYQKFRGEPFEVKRESDVVYKNISLQKAE